MKTKMNTTQIGKRLEQNPICNGVQNVRDKEMASSSKAFVADLPDLSEEQLEKLYAWGNSSCERFDLHLQEGGSMTLVAVRKKSGSARDHMRLLRTNLQNWGVSLPAKQTGWLRLVDESASADGMPQAPTTMAFPDEGAADPERSVPRVPNCSARLELPANLLTSLAVGARLCRAA